MMSKLLFRDVRAFGWLLGAVIVWGQPAMACAQAPVDFAHEVAPLLKARCSHCHLNGNREGELSFNTRAEMLQAEIVAVGDPAASELIARVSSHDDALRMPPEGDPLTAEEVQLLSKWIADGLEWGDGFTFRTSRSDRPMQLREIALDLGPSAAAPIDQLISRYLKTEQLPALRLVDDRSFYRRVSLDLVGLLPVPQAVEDFVADADPAKRAQLIDELLADDVAYADHWLSFWNDLLRNDYTGTGYIDGGREAITAWLYQSLLTNKPYDAMVRELLVPTPATAGFAKGIQWRGRINASQVPELQFAQNVGQVFLGVNLKCASCHDSFIDDWKLKDAYGLAAVVAERPLELHRCDVPQGQTATASFLFPELGQVDPSVDRMTRLQQLSLLVTKSENGRFARTIVNRLWQRMVGAALVEPVDSMESPAWNEALLDYLAADFVAHGYDLRHTLRQVARSQAYQAQAAAPPTPGEPYRFRGPLPRRMTAEQWLDGLWQLTTAFPDQAAADFGERKGAPVRAALIPATRLMTVLGRPNREQVVTTRPNQLTTLEALELANGQELADMLQRGEQAWAGRFSRASHREFLQWLYAAALSRPPTEEELRLGERYLSSPDLPGGYSDLAWAIVVSPEFFFVR